MVGQLLSFTPSLACLTWISPLFLISSAILFLIFFEKINSLSISNSYQIRISQISIIVWAVFVPLNVIFVFLGSNLYLFIIFASLTAISQFSSFFFADRIFNDLDLHDKQFVKVKTIFLLSFSFYGFIKIIPVITYMVLRFSLTRHPLSWAINIVGLLLSIGVAVILIIISNRVISMKIAPVQPVTIIETVQEPTKQFCSECGAKRMTEDKFCENCGTTFG